MFWTAAVAQALARVLYVFNHRADADEPQHLHVVWNWIRGLVQYRDAFDNHAPLFHLVMAPIVWVIGERADLLVIVRGMMMPLVAVSLWSTYRIGAALWSPRVGRWGALLAGFVPTFLLTSTEFRSDVLWMTSWMLALVALFGGSFTSRRAALAGLLLGAALATSLKTVLLGLALALAGTLTLCLFPRSRHRMLDQGGWRSIRWLIAGSLVVPLALIVAFWRLHALGPLVYCTIWHNIVPHVGLWGHGAHRMLIFPLALAGMVGASYALVRRSRERVTERQICLFLTSGLYLALLEAFWPLITKQDFLPSTPPVALLVVAAILSGLAALERGWPRRTVATARVVLLAGMCSIDLIAVCRLQLPSRYSNEREDRMILTTLRATRPGEPILDIQGETIFRPRPFYYLFESLTVARLANGSLRDDIPADIVRTRTHFVAEDSDHLPSGDRAFLNEHFVSFGALRVLGSRLLAVGDGPRAERSFDVCYAERFALVADGAPARGVLDGTRYRGPVLLQPGVHRYRPEAGERDVVAVWDVALERKLFARSPSM